MLTPCFVDAIPDFPNATIFNPSSTTGMGGFGDPNNDYQITTGAFAKDFEVAYPVPHRIRRNYTPVSTSTDPFGDGTPPAPLPFYNYFTNDSVNTLVNGFTGNLVGFHTLMEGPVVS